MNRENQLNRSVNTKAKTNAETYDRQTQASNDRPVVEDTVTMSSNKSSKSDNFNPSKLKTRRSWIQLSLVLIVTVTVTLTLSNLNLRTSDIEQTLNVFDTDLQDSISSQSEELMPEILKINKELKSVQEGLQRIKTDYSVLDKKYKDTVESSLITTKTIAVAEIDNAILEDEMQALKNELETIKSKLNTVDEPKKVELKNSINNDLTVNLASLTNEVKAEEIVKKLYAAGLIPLIQNAVVKNKRVYRISVSGFSDLEEAKLFIRNAGKLYGTSDGRIRKS